MKKKTSEKYSIRYRAFVFLLCIICTAYMLQMPAVSFALTDTAAQETAAEDQNAAGENVSGTVEPGESGDTAEPESGIDAEGAEDADAAGPEAPDAGGSDAGDGSGNTEVAEPDAADPVPSEADPGTQTETPQGEDVTGADEDVTEGPQEVPEAVEPEMQEEQQPLMKASPLRATPSSKVIDMTDRGIIVNLFD